MPTILDNYTLDPDVPIDQQHPSGWVWPGYVSGTVNMVQSIATAFAQTAGGRFTADTNFYRCHARSDGYGPNSTTVLRLAAELPIGSPFYGAREDDDTEAWYAWSLRWPSGFYAWAGIPEWQPDTNKHPGYGWMGFKSVTAGTYDLQFKVGHTVSPTGSGTSDTIGQPGISDYAPITSSSTANTTNKNGYDQDVNLLGPSAPQPLTLNKWHDFICHVWFKAQTNGTIDVWHREEGASAFTKLYSNLNDGSALINAAPHPTSQWNLKYGNASYGLHYQVYRNPGALAPTVDLDWSPYRRRGSYALTEQLFVGAPAPAGGRSGYAVTTGGPVGL